MTSTKPEIKFTATKKDPSKNIVKVDFTSKKAQDKPVAKGNVWTEERRAKQSKIMLESYAKRKTEKALNPEKKEIIAPSRIPQEIPRIGNHWVYIIRYKDIGWRVLILPVRKEIFLSPKTYNLPFKNFFADAQAAPYVQLQHFQVFSLRAEAVVPVFEGVWSPYMVKNKIRPEALLNKKRLLGFAETQKIIAGFETQRVLVDFENQVMQTANYKYAYQNAELNAIQIADDLAALVIEHSDRGQVPPSETSKTLGKLTHMLASNWKWILVIAIIAMIWGYIVMNYFLPQLSPPQYPGGVTYP